MIINIISIIISCVAVYISIKNNKDVIICKKVIIDDGETEELVITKINGKSIIGEYNGGDINKEESYKTIVKLKQL